MESTKSDTRRAWDEVGSAGTDLGGKLRRHFAQVREEDGAQAADAVRKLVEAVGDAFEAVGNAARDPEVRSDARKAAKSLTSALASTFDDLGDEVRKVFAKGRADGPDAAGGPAAGGSATGGPATGEPAGPPPSGAAWAPPATPGAGPGSAPAAAGGSHATAAPPEEQLPD